MHSTHSGCCAVAGWELDCCCQRVCLLKPAVDKVLINDSELSVKVVNTKDMANIIHLRDQPRAVKHVSFDKSGSSLSVCCTDGIVYVYSMSTEPPELIKKVDGLIKSLETDSESSSKVVWHPDGRAFVAPTATRGRSFPNCGVNRTDGDARYASHVAWRLGTPKNI
jgi:WD40 repeat protein